MDTKLQAQWTTIVKCFMYITVIWNVIEGSVSIYFGYSAADISLFAFGIDSWIEVLSASLVLYHMLFKSLPSATNINAPLKTTNQCTANKSCQVNKSKSVLFSLETERKLTLFIGCLLVIFCLFACVGGTFRLIEGVPPSSTTMGIIVGGVCVIAMFIMYYYKTKASVILNSSTLASDAACSLGCIKLSTVLLIGSILYEIWEKLWWVDAATAIVIGLLVGWEGWETIKSAKDKEKFKGGSGCCGSSDSGLAKYFREKFEKEFGKQCHDGHNKEDTCCGGDGNVKESELCETPKKKEHGCCGDDDHVKKGCEKPKEKKVDNCCAPKQKGYGAVEPLVSVKVDSKKQCASQKGCCSSK